MSKKRFFISVVVVAILGALVYLQFRHWRQFNWHVFWEETRDVDLLHLAAATALIYLTYPLRALRWKIFLKPVCHVPARRLIAPTIIGFTGLALLGRPGEFARPYLIARKQNLSMSSQIAVWTVERIFDIGAFAVLLVINIFSATDLPYSAQFRKAGFILMVAVVALAAIMFLVWRSGASVAAGVQNVLSPVAPAFGRRAAKTIQAFGEGLNTIHDLASFLQLTAVSLLVWFVISLAYLLVAHAYPGPLRHLGLSHMMLTIAFSMAGSIVQLPAIGGGAQLATIKALEGIFDIRPELAVSCGIMLWLVTFMAVTPAGLLLAHREHVSLTKVTEEGAREEQAIGD